MPTVPRQGNRAGRQRHAHVHLAWPARMQRGALARHNAFLASPLTSCCCSVSHSHPPPQPSEAAVDAVAASVAALLVDALVLVLAAACDSWRSRNAAAASTLPPPPPLVLVLLEMLVPPLLTVVRCSVPASSITHSHSSPDDRQTSMESAACGAAGSAGTRCDVCGEEGWQHVEGRQHVRTGACCEAALQAPRASTHPTHVPQSPHSQNNPSQPAAHLRWDGGHAPQRVQLPPQRSVLARLQHRKAQVLQLRLRGGRGKPGE